ncbi:MAG TPA: hypothetical protein VKL21_01505 [Candidatus Methanoperedens sp.]|nr:hypothetical protein [Candidatus Methanoperedens sp.]
MDEEQSEEHSSGVCGCGLPHDMMEGLTAEQKKKLAAMHIDIKILFFEKKIKDMESAIELKKKIIASMKQVQEIMKQSK